MTERATRIMTRISFVVCGLVSLVTAVPHVMLRGAGLPVESEWIVFVAALGLLGLFSVMVGVLPRSWIAAACQKNRDDAGLLSAPLKVLGDFAAIAYLVALIAYLAPSRWNLDPQLMFALCPLYYVKLTFDPSPLAVCFVLAPMNAAVYGSLGLTVGYVWLAFGRRRRVQAA